MMGVLDHADAQALRFEQRQEFSEQGGLARPGTGAKP